MSKEIDFTCGDCVAFDHSNMVTGEGQCRMRAPDNDGFPWVNPVHDWCVPGHARTSRMNPAPKTKPDHEPYVRPIAKPKE